MTYAGALRDGQELRLMLRRGNAGTVLDDIALRGSLSLAVHLWLALYSMLVSAVSPSLYKWHH
jgi:hypothetical protein